MTSLTLIYYTGLKTVATTIHGIDVSIIVSENYELNTFFAGKSIEKHHINMYGRYLKNMLQKNKWNNP